MGFFKKVMAESSLRGHFLLASQSLNDPNFSRSVVYLFDHSADGAAGVVINRPSKLTIEELSAKIYGSKIEWDKLIHVGGPVGGPLIMIHQISDMADEPITEDIFRTVDPDKLREMLQEQVEPSILIANYAGWGPLQLEAEISEGSWEIMPGSPAFVFWTGIKDLWDVLIGELQASQIADMLKIQKSNIDPKLN